MCWKGALLLFVMHLFTQESSALIQHLVLIEAQLFLNQAFQMGWLKHKEVKRLVWGHTANQWLCLDWSPELFKATTPWLLKRQFYPLWSDLITMKKKREKTVPSKLQPASKELFYLEEAVAFQCLDGPGQTRGVWYWCTVSPTSRLYNPHAPVGWLCTAAAASSFLLAFLPAVRQITKFTVSWSWNLSSRHERSSAVRTWGGAQALAATAWTRQPRQHISADWAAGTWSPALLSTALSVPFQLSHRLG